MSGFADVIVAGGPESMSLLPGQAGHQFRPNPDLVAHWPEVYISMGLTAENVARKYGVSREDQDAFAYRSHRRAAEAIGRGKFADETMPLTVTRWEHNGGNGPKASEVVFSIDEGVRYDTSLESLASLKPAFAKAGAVTAGNSSQTSAGAAAVVVMSGEKAGRVEGPPLGVFRSLRTRGGAPQRRGRG